MPIVIGGARHRKKHHITPKLGTKASVRTGKLIGEGSEASVHQAQAEVQGKKRSKVVSLVEKQFHGVEETRHHVSYSVAKNNPLLAKPVQQFEFVLKLRRANLKWKLGLRFPPTLRLVKKDSGKYSILMTPLDIVNPYELPPKLEEQFFRDKERQQETLKRVGVRALDDAFYCVWNANHTAVTAVIGDFGTLSILRKRKKK